MTEVLRRSRHSDTRALKAIKGHSEGNVSTPALRALGRLGHSGTQRALGHLDTRGTGALGHVRHSDTQRARGHSSTRALKHLSTLALEGHFGTRALRHSGTRALEAFETLYLANSFSFVYVDI